MSSKENDSEGIPNEWCQQFGQGALARAEQARRSLPARNRPELVTQQKIAESALEIGFDIINEIGGLLTTQSIEQSRDNIITGLSDVMLHSYPDGRHLGHDIVDALSKAVGERPSRLASCYE